MPNASLRYVVLYVSLRGSTSHGHQFANLIHQNHPSEDYDDLTRVITGESGLRAPMAESERFFQALRLKQVPSALVRIPGASHNIAQRPSQMIALVLNTAAWFERHRKKLESK